MGSEGAVGGVAVGPQRAGPHRCYGVLPAKASGGPS